MSIGETPAATPTLGQYNLLLGRTGALEDANADLHASKDRVTIALHEARAEIAKLRALHGEAANLLSEASAEIARLTAELDATRNVAAVRQEDPVSTDDRAAAIGALTATLNAGLAEDEALAKAAAESGNQFASAEFAPEWHRVNRSVMVESAAGAIVFDEGAPSEVQADHIARNDPASVLRRVKAMRDLLAAILAERHDYNPMDEYYSCSQAVDPDEDDPGEKYPGSGCSDPDRAGQPCDCGRDARVERLLAILAGVYERTA